MALPAGIGSLSLAGLLATVEGGEARALVDVLQAQVGMLVGGVVASIPADATGARVGAHEATAAHGAVVEDLRLALGDLLPVELLGLLPLSAILDLVATLPVDAGALGGVVDQLASIHAIAAELNGLQDEVAGVVGSLGDVLAPADAALTSGSGLDVNALADLIEALDPLLELLDELLEQLIGGVQDILDELALLDLDLEGLLDQVVGNLADLELVAVDRIAATVGATANAAGSLGAVECGVQGVRVLGAALPDVNVCADLVDVLDGLRVTILGTLDALPLAGGLVGDVVHIDGLRVTTTPENAANGDYNIARAVLTPLELGVASLDLAAMVDELVSGLIDELEGLIDLLDGDLLDGLGLAGTGVVDGELDAVLRSLLGSGVPLLDTGLVELSGGLDAVRANSAEGDDDLTDAVRDLLGGLELLAPAGFDEAAGELDVLRGALEALPTGDLLDGLATPGLTVRALEIASEAEFAAAGQPEPLPADPAPAPDLPRTGGGLLPLALLLLTAGGLGTATLRGRRTTD